MVVFDSNGKTCDGYLAAPDAKGPGLIVIQEWWGLVDHIKDVCDRFAAEGYVALAPDLFRGVRTTDPDEANKLMMSLEMDQASEDLVGAVRYLQDNPMVEPNKIGSVGFCMGGALSLYLATVAPIDACVDYYGLPTPEPDYAQLTGPVLGHFAEHDGWATPEKVEELFERLEAMGKQVERHSYPGTHHAFFNDARPEVYDQQAAETSWVRTIEFFGRHLKD